MSLEEITDVGAVDLLADGGRQLYLIEHTSAGGYDTIDIFTLHIFRLNRAVLEEILEVELSMSGNFLSPGVYDHDSVLHISGSDKQVRAIEVEHTIRSGRVEVKEADTWTWNGNKYELVPPSKTKAASQKTARRRLDAERARQGRASAQVIRRAAQQLERDLTRATRSLPPLFRKCGSINLRYAKVQQQIANQQERGDLESISKLAPVKRKLEQEFKGIVAEVRSAFAALVAARAEPEVVLAAQKMGRASCNIDLTVGAE